MNKIVCKLEFTITTEDNVSDVAERLRRIAVEGVIDQGIRSAMSGVLITSASIVKSHMI